MMKSRPLYFFFLFATVLLIISCNKKNKSALPEVKKLSDYPSASGIEYFNYRLYVIGDDANYLLVLDTNLNISDSIPLYSYPEKRISKSIKPDLEAIAIAEAGGEKALLLMGSGSLSPYRDMAWLINPVTNKKDSVRLDHFFASLKNKGLKEINIEGACSLPDGSFILANRGHKAYPFNYFIYTSGEFWKDTQRVNADIITVGENKDSTSFSGVSGISYAPVNDALILTVSTEDTRSVHEDGAIGKSYLWIIKNISAKNKTKPVFPDRIIDLDSADSRFKGQKIESVCVTGESKDFLRLVLAADNDDGSSTLFKLMLKKE